MKKLVNGKTVNIDNIELFILANEGLVLQDRVYNTIDNILDVTTDLFLVKRYINEYNLFLKAMPYPLYAIEEDIKYAALANLIKSVTKDKVSMWVYDGLYIKLSNITGETLRLVGNAWQIVHIEQQVEDNTDLELYSDELGYEEYRWLVDKVLNKQNISDFYEEFMPNFIKACNNDDNIIKKELLNILNFDKVSNESKFKDNVIINRELSAEYTLDIYCNGQVETEDTISTWSLLDNKPKCGSRYSNIKTYDYDLYMKELFNKSKSTITKLAGIRGLFNELCAYKNLHELESFPKFKGIIIKNKLAFTIEDTLYITYSNKLRKVEQIDTDVKLYGADKERIYYSKEYKIRNGMIKRYIYSVNLHGLKTSLCKIEIK